MTIGIYKLNFDNTYKVYIGQSKDIEYRFKKHILILKNNKASKKLQEAYNKYGYPKLEIIKICDILDLDTYEDKYIKIYNSVDAGFNTHYVARGGNYLFGENSARAEYSNSTYINIFEFLYNNPTKTYKEIGDILNVSENIVANIARGTNHKWLKEIFQDKYNELLSRIGSAERYGYCNSAKALGKTYPMLISPAGTLHNIENIRQFALKNNLDRSDLGKVLRGKKKHVKGFKLYIELGV